MTAETLVLEPHRPRRAIRPALWWLVVPALLAGARGCYGVLYGTAESMTDALRWIKFLLVFDSMAVILGLWLFEPLCAQE